MNVVLIGCMNVVLKGYILMFCIGRVCTYQEINSFSGTTTRPTSIGHGTIHNIIRHFLKPT